MQAMENDWNLIHFECLAKDSVNGDLETLKTLKTIPQQNRR